MKATGTPRPNVKSIKRACATLMLAATTLIVASTSTQNAIANGDTRSLRLYHSHTRESLTITFKKDGRYDPEALKQLNWFLRDWRRSEPIRMEPRLFDIVWEVYRDVGATQAITVVCGYRSPQTNNMLRSRSSGVAKFSQHTLGRAMDMYIPGVPTVRLREAGLRLQRGGVGFYPTANTPFVHLDAGNVRHWPKMTRDQLVRLFPDGKTVHIPADGKPLSGYALAAAEVERNGGTLHQRFGFSNGTQMASAQRRGGFFSRLFGNEEDDGEESAGAGTQVAEVSRADERYSLLQPHQRRTAELRSGPPAPGSEPEETPAPAAATTPATTASVPLPPVPPPVEAIPAPVVEPQVADLVPMPEPRPGDAPAAEEPAAVVAEAPALPLPRPETLVAAAQVEDVPLPESSPVTATAFAAEAPNPWPVNRPSSAREADAPLVTAAISPQATRAAMAPAKIQLSPGDRIARVHALKPSPMSASYDLSADMVTAPLNDNAFKGVLSPELASYDPGQAMAHPDQNNLKVLMGLPGRVLAQGFKKNQPLTGSDHFAGGAVAILQSRVFNRAAPADMTASIPPKRS